MAQLDRQVPKNHPQRKMYAFLIFFVAAASERIQLGKLTLKTHSYCPINSVDFPKFISFSMHATSFCIRTNLNVDCMSDSTLRPYNIDNCYMLVPVQKSRVSSDKSWGCGGNIFLRHRRIMDRDGLSYSTM